MATILVVDDRPVNRELLTTLLGYAGHRLLEAASGESGLALARAEHPDLIITDIVMPTMDGYEFARLVRADPALAQTPVVFYTSSYVIAETRRLADACGVAHIISKPAEPEDILLTVDLALAAPPAPLAPLPSEEFHEEHMRLLTDKLSAKVDELEAENAERRRAEEALGESEAHLRRLFESAPISIWEEDFSRVKDYLDHLPGGQPADIDAYLTAHPEVVAACVSLVRVIDVNQATLALLEAPNKAALLGQLVVAFTPESQAIFQQELVAVARGVTRLRLDAVVITASGRRREATLDWALVPGHEQNYARVLISLVDLTERKQAEQVLAQTNDLLSRAEQIGHIGSFSRDAADNRVTWSDGLYRLLGIDKQTMEPSFAAYLEQVHPDDRLRVRLAIERAYREPGPYGFETRIVRPDGQTRVLDSRAEVLADARGQATRLVGLAIDITERKQAEEAQLASEERYRLLFELNPLPMWVYDTQGLNFLAANAAAEAHYGYSAEEFRTMTVRDIRPPAELPRLMATLAGLAGGAPSLERSGIWKHRKKDGGLIDVEVVSHSILFAGHAARLVLAIDVTERLLAEAQAQRQMDRLGALRAIDTAITASLDLRLTLQMVLDQVTSQLRVDAADVYLMNNQSHAVDFAAGRGFRSGAWPKISLRMGQGYAGRVALERQTLAVPDLAQPRPAGPRAAAFEAEGFRAFFGVPLIAKGQVVGVLEVFHRAPLYPDPDWLNFLEALAGQAAIAIDNAALFNDLQQANQNLGLAYDATIEGWSRALDLRDHETEGHSQRVTEMTLRLAERLRLEPEQMIHLRRGALLHDIGKMAIPDSVLLKPEPLSADEWVIMRQHPVYAYDLLAPINYLRAALDIPYCHHEKWDGTGYPRQLKGSSIPLPARIFAVVDVWDALGSDRPYRRAWPPAQVRDHIRALAGTHFDPEVVTAFEQLLDEDA